MTTSRLAVAAHEAGHATVAWHTGSVRAVSYARLSPLGGQVEWLAHHADGLHAPTDELWVGLVIAVAGIAGQFRVDRTVKAIEARGDLDSARRQAELLARRLACEPGGVERAFPVSTADRQTLARMYATELDPAVRHLLEAAYLKAKLVLRHRSAEYRAIRWALLWKRELDTSALTLLIGRRPRARLFARRAVVLRLWSELRSGLGRVLFLLFLA